MKVVKLQLSLGGMFYHPLCAGRTSDTDLEISANETLVFVCMDTSDTSFKPMSFF